MDIFKCCECQKDFTALYNLREHAKKFHPDKVNIIAPRKTYKYQCEDCKKSFNNLRDFNCHKNKHQFSSEKTISKRQCPLCNFTSLKTHVLAHFETDHEIKIDTNIFEFTSAEEFIAWKKQIENSTKSQFVKERGTFSSNNHNIIKYFCHRFGNYISKSKGLRHLKTQGSNKINGFCPASMKVIIDKNDKCKVVFVDKHVGHENDLGHLSLTFKERETLANKMALKIPFSQILDEVRDSVEGSQLERIHLLTKKDLYNIEKSFNLQSTVVRHQNDAVSVEAWIKEMESSGCILFYKAQDIESVEHTELRKEDFVLIIMNPGQEEVFKKYCSDCVCLDGTHGLNQYDFELHTLLILDDVREGFPCAFLISNRSDEYVMRIFFHYVKDRIGFQVNCKVFMSDMAEVYYNAWKILMGPAEFRLFCTWHVDRAWRKNLSKIKCKEQQVMVYKYLRTMLQERDEGAFSSMLDYFVSSMISDSDTADFAEYFKNNYVRNIRSWAYCYRLNSGLNTNMHVERMHRTIKYIYFNGRKVKRLDKAIHEIQKFVRDRLFNRLIVLNKGKLSSKLKELRIRHKISEKLTTDLIIKNGVRWEISSTSPNCFEVYSVEGNQHNFSCECKLTCTECNTCIHKYSCTCIDSCIKWNMCKHIHLLCRYLKQKPDAPDLPLSNNTLDDTISLPIYENPASDEANGILTGLNHAAASTNSIEDEARVAKEKEKIMANLIPHLIKVAENIICMEQVDAFKKLCAPIAPTVTAIGNRHTEMRKSAPNRISLSPHNKKIIPQRNKLHSTKNKKKKGTTSKRLTEPTFQEKQEIALCAILNPAN